MHLTLCSVRLLSEARLTRFATYLYLMKLQFSSVSIFASLFGLGLEGKCEPERPPGQKFRVGLTLRASINCQ